MEYQMIHAPEKDSSSIAASMQTNENVQNWEIGQIIDGKYQILSILAQDSNKIIYKVRHAQWNIPLAVRSQIKKEDQVRFFHQAQRWVELRKHPNVVSAYYVQHIGGIPRLFVEYVTNAKTLQEFISSQSQLCDLEMVIDIAIQISWGMEHAHKCGLLHGDLRPGNIFLTTDGDVKIADFRSREDVSREYTVYMPPEQFEKDWPAQPSMDIYALGMILYELCTNRLPFKFKKDVMEESDRESCRNIILSQSVMTPIKYNSSLPTELSEFIMQCISKIPQDRPKDFEVIIEKLQKIYLDMTGLTYPRKSPDIDKLCAVDLNNRALSILDLGESNDTAEELLEEALKADPLCMGALINLQLLQLRSGRSSLSKFRTVTDALLPINREVVTFYRARIALEKGGFLEESLEDVKEAVALFPENKELQRLQGLLLYECGRVNDAITVFENLVAVETPSKNDLYYLGGGYLQTEQKKRALEIWTRALSLFPNDLNFMIAKAVTLAKQQKVEEAYSCFREIQTQQDNFWVLLNIAEISATFSMYVSNYKKASPILDEAQKVYERLIQIAPFLPRVVYGYQYVFPDKELPEVCFESIQNNQASENGLTHIMPQWRYSHGLSGHENGVHSMTLTPDGRTIIAGGADSLIRLWDTETYACKNILRGHTDGVSQVIVSHDGHFLISIGHSSTAFVWDLISGECVAKLEGHVRDITCIAVSCTGYIVTGSLDNTLRIWDLGALTCKKILRGHETRINTIEISPDGHFLVSGDENGRIIVWDLEQGILLNSFDRHSEAITCIAISANNRYVVSGSWDQNIVISSLDNAEEFFVLSGHVGTINCIAITSDSRLIISGSEDKSIRIWDIEKHECIRTLSGHKMDVTSIAIGKNDLFFASGSWDHTVRIWHTATGQCIGSLESHIAHVNIVVISPDSKFIFSAGDEPTLRIWHDATTLLCPILEEEPLSYLLQSTHSNPANFEAQRKVEQLINEAEHWKQENNFKEALARYREIQNISTFETNERVLNCIYDIEEQGKLKRTHCRNVWVNCVLKGHTAPITQVWGNKDTIVSASEDNTLKIWSHDGKCLSTLTGHKKAITCMDISPNSRLIVSGSKDNTVKLWELETGRCVYTMDSHHDWIECVKFTPDGRRIVSAGRDGYVEVWERKTGHRLYHLDNHTDLISDIAISPDSTLLFTASHDRSIRIWNLENGECLDCLEGHEEHVRCLAYVPRLKKLLSGGWDNLIMLWDIEQGECVQTWKKHESWINKIVVPLECTEEPLNRAFSSSLDHTIRLWNIDNGKCIGLLQEHEKDITDLLCSPDGTFCISSSMDQTVRIWNTNYCTCEKTLHTDAPVTCLYSFCNNRYLLGGTKDNNIILWQCDWTFLD